MRRLFLACCLVCLLAPTWLAAPALADQLRLTKSPSPNCYTIRIKWVDGYVIKDTYCRLDAHGSTGIAYSPPLILQLAYCRLADAKCAKVCSDLQPVCCHNFESAWDIGSREYTGTRSLELTIDAQDKVKVKVLSD